MVVRKCMYLCTIFINQLIGLVGRVFSKGPGNLGLISHTNDFKNGA